LVEEDGRRERFDSGKGEGKVGFYTWKGELAGRAVKHRTYLLISRLQRNCLNWKSS
jgi:hypothetical protein